MDQIAHKPKPERYGLVIGLKSDYVEHYKTLHADVWPGVLKQIAASNIRNYSIHLVELKKSEFYLFAYFDYVGDDFEADTEKMALDETTVRWWKETDPMQVPIETAKEGEHWTRMQEVFYHE